MVNLLLGWTRFGFRLFHTDVQLPIVASEVEENLEVRNQTLQHSCMTCPAAGNFDKLFIFPF
jgi:hypothetical protein